MSPPNVFVHPQGLCESGTVGEGTRIWAFAHVLAGARIGRGCNICDHVFIESDVVVGDDVTIKCGVQLWDGVRLGDGVFVPAKIVGYQETGEARPTTLATGAGVLPDAIGARLDLGIRDCWIERLPNFGDMRGNLTAVELDKGLPFPPSRYFLVHGVPSHDVRGEHAHIECEQFLIAANGGVSVVLDDGDSRMEVRLGDPTMGLYLAPMVWGIQYKFDPGTVLIVAASHSYDPADYIRDYAVFRDAVRAGR